MKGEGCELSRRMVSAGIMVLGLIPVVALGAVLLADDFEYPDGDLISNGTWACSNAAAPMIQVSGGHVLVSHGSRYDEFTSAPLLHPIGGNYWNDLGYYAVQVTVPSCSLGYQGTAGDYFVSLCSQDGAHFPARVFVCRGWEEDDSFTFGLSAEYPYATGAIHYWPGSFAFDTKHVVVVYFDNSDGTATMWVDPISEMSPSISCGGATSGLVIDRIGLHGGHVTDSLQIIDSIRVGSTFSDAINSMVPVENSSWGDVKALYR